jgi:hypothetical protein
VQLNYSYTSFFTADFAEVEELESIKTSKSFTKRGDKDCRHRSVNGIAFASSSDDFGNITARHTARGGDPAYVVIGLPSTGRWSRTVNDRGATEFIRDSDHWSLWSNMVLCTANGFKFLGPKEFTVVISESYLSGDLEDGPNVPANPYIHIHMRWRVQGLRAYYTCEIFDATTLTDLSFTHGFLWYHRYGDPVTVEHAIYHGYVQIRASGGSVDALTRHESGTDKVLQTVYPSGKAFFSTQSTAGSVPMTSELFSSIRNRVRLMSHTRLDSLQFAAPYGEIPGALKTKLISDAIEDAKVLTINSIAFLRDLRHVKELVVPLLKLKKRPLSAKAWANLWLSYEYGIRLLLQDIHEIVKKLPQAGVKFSLTHVRSAARRTLSDDEGRETEVLYHCKVILDPRIGPIVSLYDKLRRLDLVVSRENLWDFVPYSFVVDWFIPIGQALSHLDLRDDLSLFGAKVAIFSSKASRSLATKVAPEVEGRSYYVNLALNFTVYNRWHEEPTISVPDIDLSNGLNIRRGADGFALLVQKSKP